MFLTITTGETVDDILKQQFEDLKNIWAFSIFEIRFLFCWLGIKICWLS